MFIEKEKLIQTILFLCVVQLSMLYKNKCKEYNKLKDLYEQNKDLRLGEEFIGKKIKFYKNGVRKVGTIIEYMRPTDEEHGYDWVVDYPKSKFTETFNLDEILKHYYEEPITK